MAKKFYGVYAINGLGIYTSWGKLLSDQLYMRGEKIQGFSTREAAEEFALEGFERIHGCNRLFQTFPDSGDYFTNYYYFVK